MAVGELVAVRVADGLGVTEGVTCTAGSPPVSGKASGSSVFSAEQAERITSSKIMGNQ